MTNCPPVYRNIQCESFNNKKKITSQLLRQFCKNDAYLYAQIQELWDYTDPETRKRFYPPDFMDVSRSFGIESYILQTEEEREENNYCSEVYRFNDVKRFKYFFNFDNSDDKISESYFDADVRCIDIQADSFLDLENNYNTQKLEIVNEDGVTTLRPHLTTSTYEEINHYNATYTTKKANTSTKYVETKEKLGKGKVDAHFYGAFNNWHCNNHWYNGFNRTKNYNVKSDWKKNQDSYDIPSVCHSQTFKAQNTGRVSKVQLNIQGTKSAVSPCIVEIRTTSKNGYPTTKVLARAERKFGGGGQNVVAFEFKNKAFVTKGETYAIVVRSPLSHFENTFRVGGWTTGCFSSESKYYKYGSAFLSEDNGKTWIKNGKTSDKKSYGSHYYDWGINQKPVDLAFEVTVQPIVQQAIKKKVSGNNVKQLIEEGYTLVEGTTNTYRKLVKEAYDITSTYEYTYYKDGSYYLHLKPIQTNPIDYFMIFSTFVNPQGQESHYSEYWKWEYYNQYTGLWTEINNEENNNSNSNIVDFDNNIVDYTVLKLRIRCDVDGNIYSDTTSTISDDSLNGLISSNKLIQSGLTYLKQATLRIETKAPVKAYLRTKYYHPEQTRFLGANIWNEIGVNLTKKRYATVDIDVIHEKETIEHYKFYDLNILNNADMNNLTVEQEELFLLLVEHITHFETNIDITTASAILDYIYDDYTKYNSVFLNYLKKLIIPIYFLPFYYNNSETPINLFDKLELSHLPSYPLNASEISDDDILLDDTQFTRASDYGFAYELEKDISKTIDSIDVTYYTNLEISDEFVVDTEGFEINNSDYEERIEEKLKGIILDSSVTSNNLWGNNNSVQNGIFDDDTIDYALTSDGKWVIFNSHSPMIQKLFPNRYNVSSDITLNPNGNYDTPSTFSDNSSVHNFNIKINLSNKSYQEYVDFKVDYDNGTLEFYNQDNLIVGDFRITYNPLWVRGLSVADFPLKLDLWKEKYIVGTDDIMGNGIFKRVFDTETAEYVNSTFYEKTDINPYTKLKGDETWYRFKTTVPPRDNIRKLTLNGNELEEDTQYFVDYLSNEVILFKTNLAIDDVLEIHYTPNLTDDGLALAYRLNRPRYDRNGIQVADEDDLSAQPNNLDNVYIGMNYFTYRT